MSIKKMIDSLFNKTNKSETFDLHNTTPTDSEIANVTNKIYAFNSNLSFENVNFGYYSHVQTSIEEEPPFSSFITATTTTQLEDIQDLVKSYNFKNAIDKYKEILEDYRIMNAIDNDTKSRILLGIISCYVNLRDFENAEKYIRRFKEDNLPLNEKGYSIIFTYYINQNKKKYYFEAEVVAEDFLKNYPNSSIGVCSYALVKSIVNEGFDGLAYLEDNLKSKLDNRMINNRYHETLFSILALQNRFEDIIGSYKAMEVEPSLLLNAQYINALYANSLHKTNKKYITRADINFERLLLVWNSILKIEEKLSEYEKLFFRQNIAEIYINCLVLLGQNKPQSIYNLISYTRPELKESISLELNIFENVKLNEGKKDVNYEDLKRIRELFQDQKYDELYNSLWPAIKNNKDYQRIFKHALLVTCINIRDDYPNAFLEVLDYYHDNKLYDMSMKLFECMYIYKSESKVRALKDMEYLFNNSHDPAILLDLIRFSLNVNENEFARHKLLNIRNSKKFVIEIEPNEYFGLWLKLYANTFIDNSIVSLSEEMKNYCLDNMLKLKVIVAEAEFNKNFPVIASTNHNLFVETRKINYLYSACENYLKIYNLPEAMTQLELLSKQPDVDLVSLNILFSQYYILDGDNDNAFIYAERAKNLAANLPMSPAHQSYWSLCMRIEKVEEMSYIYDYTTKYPRHTQWVKSFKAIETDEFGNEVPTPELMEIFNNARDEHERIMGLYRDHYALGISLIKDRLEWKFSDLVPRLNKLKVFSGEVTVFNEENRRDIESIVLDPLGLYFLEKIECLNLLHNCTRVYLSYSTIIALVNDLLNKEDQSIRNILRFIYSSSNIILTYVSEDEKEVIEKLYANIKIKTGTFVCLLDSVILSLNNDISYVYLDMSSQPLAEVTNSRIISLFAFIKIAFSKQWITDKRLGEIILQIFDYKFDFINLNEFDIYCAIIANNYVINEPIINLFEMKVHADIASHIAVFCNLINKLKNKHATREKVILAILTSFDKRHGRTRYMDYTAEKYNNRDEFIYVNTIRSLCEQAISYISAFLFETKTINEIYQIYDENLRYISKDNHEKILNRAEELFEKHLK